MEKRFHPTISPTRRRERVGMGEKSQINSPLDSVKVLCWGGPDSPIAGSAARAREETGSAKRNNAGSKRHARGVSRTRCLSSKEIATRAQMISPVSLPAQRQEKTKQATIEPWPAEMVVVQLVRPLVRDL